MTWLVWRQYRTSAAIGAALLAAFAVLMVITGLHAAAQFHAAFGSCLAAGNCPFPSEISLDGGSLGFVVAFAVINRRDA